MHTTVQSLGWSTTLPNSSSQDTRHDSMTPQGGLLRPCRMARIEDSTLPHTLLGTCHAHKVDNHVIVSASRHLFWHFMIVISMSNYWHGAPRAAGVAANLDSSALNGPAHEVHNHLLEPGAARQERQ